MAINVSTLAPASLKSKNVATEQYVDSSITTVNNALTALAASEEARDGTISTFYQTTAPTSGMDYGDYWLDTDDSSYTVYRYQNTNGFNVVPLSWIVSTSTTAKAIQSAYRAEKVAASKITTFYSATQPVANGVGDLWVSSSNNTMYRWSGTSWVTITVDVSSQLPDTITSTSTPGTTVKPKGSLWRQTVTVNGTTQYNHWLSMGNGSWQSIGGTYIDAGNIITGSINADRLDVNSIFSKNITYTGVITGGNTAGGGMIRSYNGKMEIDLVNGSIFIQ